MRSNGIEKAFFFQKLQKIAQGLGASPPDPSLIRLRYISIFYASPNLDSFA